MTKFKEGDVVKLKSSGLKMTVEAIGQGFMGNEIQCVWFDKDSHIQLRSFKKEALTKVSTEE